MWRTTGKGGKAEWEKIRETNHERPVTPGNKPRVAGREMGEGGWGDRVMGTKEGTGCAEHWVSHTTDESLSTPSRINDALYAG